MNVCLEKTRRVKFFSRPLVKTTRRLRVLSRFAFASEKPIFHEPSSFLSFFCGERRLRKERERKREREREREVRKKGNELVSEWQDGKRMLRRKLKEEKNFPSPHRMNKSSRGLLTIIITQSFASFVESLENHWISRSRVKLFFLFLFAK